MSLDFDLSMLRGKIREKCKTETAFGLGMGWSLPTISAKLNGKKDFKQSEIIRACDLLDIPYQFIPVYFFTKKVSNSKQGV